MDYTRLGRTGFTVSRAGLGCGGSSKLGTQTGKSEKQSLEIIYRAVERGVNLIDTAEVYGNEELVGNALKNLKRDDLIISSKIPGWDRNAALDLENRLDQSLRRLGTDYLDIYFLHGVTLDHYDFMVQEIVPIMRKMQEKGKIRFCGITEAFGQDTSHKMAGKAAKENYFDVQMIGFNLLNQSALESVIPYAEKNDIGILVMFAVRRVLNSRENLKELLLDLHQNHYLQLANPRNPLGFLDQFKEIASLQDAAYRFCRDSRGMDCILSGTGNINHLYSNLDSFERPPLPKEFMDLVTKMFRAIEHISGN